MLMTKEEAAQTWCPQTTRTGRAGEQIACCISGQCALWEWADAQKTKGECGMKRKSVVVLQQQVPAMPRANSVPIIGVR